MECSIIIPYHSNETYLTLNLNSLKKTVPRTAEIIIVINNSQKEASDIKIDNKRFKVLKVQSSVGYSRAINMGAERSTGKYLIFSDCDTVFMDPYWFKNLTAFYSSNKNIGIASSKLVNPYSKRIIDFGMALSKYNNIHPFMDRKLAFAPTLKNRKVQMACSANMIIEKELFIKMGMFDTDLYNYYQDTDLCLRLKDFNKECWVVASSIVYHKGSSSTVRRENYRADVKGYYVAKNLHRMEVDADKYFKLNFEYIKHRYTGQASKKKYLLVDMSTIADSNFYSTLIQDYFRLYDVYDFKYPSRDIDKISLIDFLGTNIMLTKVPIIYFVDRFISLRENSLWAEFRDCNDDIIIDRNTNIIPFKQLKFN